MGLRCKILTIAFGVFSVQIALLTWINWDKFEELSSSKSDVLLVSYHRSGSSFMSELVASCERCSYFFEPLFYEDHIRHQSDPRSYVNILKNIYSCNNDTLNHLRNHRNVWMVRKFGRKFSTFQDIEDVTPLCIQDPYHIVKTIRLRLKNTAKKLLDEIPTLKIVHLVRDPRAILNSVRNYADVWNSKEKSAEQLCREMLSDVEVGATLPKHRYFLVRYEDFIKDVYNYTSSILQFLNIPFTARVNHYIHYHVAAENDPIGKKEANEYFSTFRNSSFVHDRWKFQLSAENIKTIETECSSIMNALEYPTFQILATD